MRILISVPNFSSQALQAFRDAGAEVRVVHGRSEVLDVIDGCHAAVIGLDVVFDEEVLSRATALSAIATATTGLDHIDLGIAKDRRIEILSLRDESEFLDTITGTAELALALAISLARRIPAAHQAVTKEGNWKREDFRGVSLYGKTLGVVGMGRLGHILARAAEGLRMKVVFSDITEKVDIPASYTKMPLHELLAVSDFVSLNVHLADETAHLLSAEELSLMKPTAFLINTSRGGVVDEEALLSVLREGKIAGYGADVLDGELSFKDEDAYDHPLVALARSGANVIITPHIGGVTTDSREATDLFITKKLLRYGSDSLGWK